MIKYDKQAARNTELSYSTPDIIRQRQFTLQALGLQVGERVLDIGCGTGFLSSDMAMLVGEQGYILGIDKSADMLETAHGRCSDIPQIELQQADADAIPVADGSFDVVTCTQVLLYVPDLAATLKEIFRVLRPGGRFAIIETDWRGAILNSSDETLAERVFKAWQDAVPNPNLPPVLGPKLRALGAEGLRIEAIPIVNTSQTMGNFSSGMVQWMADKAIKQGSISAAEAVAFKTDLKQKDRDGEYFFCVNRFLFSGVKVNAQDHAL